MRRVFVVACQGDCVGFAFFGEVEKFLEPVAVIDDGIVDEQQPLDVSGGDAAGGSVPGCSAACGLHLQVASPHAEVESAILGQEQLDFVIGEEFISCIGELAVVRQQHYVEIGFR